MQNNGKEMEWRHIQDLYEKITNPAIASSFYQSWNRRRQSDSYSCMRVDLAAQVKSSDGIVGLTIMIM